MENIEAKQLKWEELSISNDFLFGKVMQNPELCKELLQRILPDLDIDHVEYPELQKAIKEDFDAKGVRLDVYVNDGKGTVYDIECKLSLQNTAKENQILSEHDRRFTVLD